MHGKRIALAAAVALCLPAHAVMASDFDFYAGGFGGYGSSSTHSLHDPTLGAARDYTLIDHEPASAFFGGYGGAGYGPLAIEGGALTLPTSHGYAEALNPPRHAHQTISGWAYYVRGVVRVPPQWHWFAQPYAFFGAARVYGANHEVGNCTECGPGYVPDWHNWTLKWTPYYGLGTEIPIYGPVSTRLEFGWLPHAVNSFWTGDKDYALGTVSLQVRF